MSLTDSCSGGGDIQEEVVRLSDDEIRRTLAFHDFELMKIKELAPGQQPPTVEELLEEYRATDKSVHEQHSYILEFFSSGLSLGTAWSKEMRVKIIDSLDQPPATITDCSSKWKYLESDLLNLGERIVSIKLSSFPLVKNVPFQNLLGLVHAVIIIKTNKHYISVEKLRDIYLIQQSNIEDDVDKSRLGLPRGPETVLDQVHFAENNAHEVELKKMKLDGEIKEMEVILGEFFSWFKGRRKLSDEYKLLGSNCQTFVEEVWPVLTGSCLRRGTFLWF